MKKVKPALTIEQTLHRSNWRRVALVVVSVLGVGGGLFTVNKELPERLALVSELKAVNENLSHSLRSEAGLTGSLADANDTITAKEKQVAGLTSKLDNAKRVNDAQLKELGKHQAAIKSYKETIAGLEKDLKAKPKPATIYKDREKVVYKDRIVYRDKPVEMLAKGERILYNGFESMKVAIIDNRQVVVNGTLYARTSEYFYGAPSYVSKSGKRLGVYRQSHGDYQITSVIVASNKAYR